MHRQVTKTVPLQLFMYERKGSCEGNVLNLPASYNTEATLICVMLMVSSRRAATWLHALWPERRHDSEGMINVLGEDLCKEN